MTKRQGRRKAVSGNFDRETLKILFRRIVNLEKEKAAELANFNADIKTIYGEAKDAGFSTKILRAMVGEHLAPKKNQEDVDLENIYREALGMTPIEMAIAAKAVEEAAPAEEGSKKKKKGEAGGGGGAGEVAEANGAAAADEVVDRSSGEVTQVRGAQEAATIIEKVGKKRVALVPCEGGFKIDRAENARGSMGKLLDLVHDALIDAGFEHHSGGVYRAAAEA